jgi:hypothetical protein
MAIDLPEVIPTTRTVKLGGESFGRETFAVELETQSLADVRSLIRSIVREQTDQQTALGNPPALLEVDNTTNKPLAAVDKKAVVVYGVTLATAAMRSVELELAAAIDASTTTRSGTLRNIQTSWQWLLIPHGGAARPVNASSPVLTFSTGDLLVLVPRQVPYSTITNRNVARSGRLSVAPRAGRPVNRKLQNMGFLAAAARVVRRRVEFKQFVVAADFTRTHMVPGELMTRTQGTGYIKIRPRFRLARV